MLCVSECIIVIKTLYMSVRVELFKNIVCVNESRIALKPSWCQWV